MELAWGRAQQVNVKLKIKISAGVVVGCSVSSAAIGASPIPFSDALLLVPLQTSMLVGLMKVWGLSPMKHPKLIALMTALQTVASAGIDSSHWFLLLALGGLGLASALKLIPGVGTIIGAIINGTVATVMTCGIGIGYTFAVKKWHNQDLSLEELDAVPFEAIKKIFLDQLHPRKIKEYMAQVKPGSLGESVHRILEGNEEVM